jgi:sulfite exporter TauE/SafE
MNDEEVGKLLKLQRVRRVVVYAALGLLVLSFVHHDRGLAGLRGSLWAAAGVLSVLEALGLKKLGQAAGNAWFNAALYFGVAILPFVRGF